MKTVSIIALALVAGYAQAAQTAPKYPDKPVRLIVPLAAGGGMDTVTRAVASPLAERLAQTVVVDNRPGGGGAIGAEITRDAPKDGHTLLMGSATFVIHPLLYPARYSPTRDYSTITQVTRQPYVLMVHPSVPAKTVRELVAHLKANPDKFQYASSGQGSLIHLATELFKVRTGTQMVHVPYKGMGAAYTDMLSGRIQTSFPSIISVMPHLKTGKLRAIAVSSVQRAASLPDVPTVQESGVPDFDVNNWYGLFAPAGTPRTVIDRIHREVVEILKTPDMLKRMAADGSEPVGSSPAEFAAHIKAETARWSEVIKKSNIKAD
ncbi:MAG: Bug family tripartite tricarboxylate transporter substrate binding protein [Betaproteobacteria bacterium]|jgi:tripartite-type tricarboxylate transporter receptor subunit TctC|nr:tripartite tricarboxylate transporter substrate binding protein [Betaproteobacteria bacterium]